MISGRTPPRSTASASDAGSGRPRVPPGSVAWLGGLAIQLIRRPRLAITAVRQAFVLAPQNWWRSWPPLPLPAADYLHFRSVTAYGGDGEQLPDAADVTAWLSWVQAWPAVTENAPIPAESAN